MVTYKKRYNIRTTCWEVGYYSNTTFIIVNRFKD